MVCRVESVCLLVALMYLGVCKAQKCVALGQCACRMSDGSGTVDLSKLPLSWLLVADAVSSSLYAYQPCQPFTSSQDCQAQTGTVLCQSYMANGIQHSRSLGSGNNVNFVVNQTGGITLRYFQQNTNSSVDVTLVCTKAETSFQLVKHEKDNSRTTNSSILEFHLRSPSACQRPLSSGISVSFQATPLLTEATTKPPTEAPTTNETTTTTKAPTTKKAPNITTNAPTTLSPAMSNCYTTRDLEIVVPVTFFTTLVIILMVFMLLFKCHVIEKKRYRSI